MRVRVSLVMALMGALVALSAPAALAGETKTGEGIESFFAANCNELSAGNCKKVPPAEEKEKAEEEGYTQAAGHPNFGITDFTLSTVEVSAGVFAPTRIVNHIRTDVAPGVSTNPQTVPMCSGSEFGELGGAKNLAGTEFFTAPACSGETELGVNKAEVYAGPFGDLKLEGKVYNLVQPVGLGSEFGVALKLPKTVTEAILLGSPYKGIKAIVEAQYYAHTLIKGNVEWGKEPAGTEKADYHDYFEIEVSPALPLISSRLVFNGQADEKPFLTNPTSCNGIGAATTTKLRLEFTEGSPAEAKFEDPIGTEKCGLVPFTPTFGLKQGTTASDTPDALTTEASLPHNTIEEQEEGTFDDSDLKTAEVKLPEGITLNPSSLSGLEACTEEQFGIGTKHPVSCPEGSKLGTVKLDVPGLPPGALQGNLYLGGNAPITKQPYILWVSAESARYGLVVRIKGTTVADESTGQLTTTFKENPEQPFSRIKLEFNGGPLAPLANALKCEASKPKTKFTPFSGGAATEPVTNFEVTGCPETLPFALSQATSNDPNTAGSHTSDTFTLARSDGQQYLKTVKTRLPAGLIGQIPTVTQCGEPQASEGTCPASSRIGTATVTAGAGRIPFTFSGPVYFTGPYAGAPFGLSVAVPAVGGPFNFGLIVSRAKINVDQTTARVTVESEVPTIDKPSGTPIRLRTLTVAVNKQGFLYNPTNCGEEAYETTIGGQYGGTQSLSTKFQAEGCSGLPFGPGFAAKTGANYSKVNGASLETTLTQPGGQSNIKSVKVTLPKQLPSRLTTLQKACLEGTFAANPPSCPEASMVGTAKAITPVLPTPMTGTAYLVSHGGAAFPDLDLVLEGSGVKVILVGNTDIKNGITTTTFASTPDVPVTSVTVSLPTGPHSALAGFGDLCAGPLYMPTTITGQNGAVVTLNTRISVTSCGVKVIGKKVIGKTAYLTLKTFGAGRVTASGRGVHRTSRTFGSSQNSASLKVKLTRGKRTIKITFTTKTHSAVSSTTSVTVRAR